MERPRTDALRALVTTPLAATMVDLLGGHRTQSVTLTNDEKRAMDRLYGFIPEQPRQRPPQPIAPKRADFPDGWKFDDAVRAHKAAMDAWQRWEDPQSFAQAGADRNAFRHAEGDGLRMLAWIARYVEPGSDPLKALVQLASNAGWDVDPADVGWCKGSFEEDASEDG